MKEVSNLGNEDFESKRHLNDIERKYLQSDNKETEPIQNDVPAETFVAENIVPVEKISGDEEDIEVKKQSPITVLSEDEKCMFEDDRVPVSNATRVSIKNEFHSQEDEVIVPKRKKLKVIEFASVTR